MMRSRPIADDQAELSRLSKSEALAKTYSINFCVTNGLDEFMFLLRFTTLDKFQSQGFFFYLYVGEYMEANGCKLSSYHSQMYEMESPGVSVEVLGNFQKHRLHRN